jgi:hypothetical protein
MSRAVDRIFIDILTELMRENTALRDQSLHLIERIQELERLLEQARSIAASLEEEVTERRIPE